MNDARGTNEAPKPRSFFDDKILHLQGLVGNLSSRLQNGRLKSDDDKQIIENFVDTVNGKMRAVQGYSEKLEHSVCGIYQHILQVAAEIPSTIDINQDSFRTDPLINSLFVNIDDIKRLFETSPEISTYLRVNSQQQVPVVYALLTACKSEKSMLGSGMVGDMLVRDISQQAVNFSSHKLLTPCADGEELNSALKKYLFDHLVALIKQEMSLRIAAQALNPGDNSFESRVKSLANPDVYLMTLLELLENPVNLLRIEKTHYKLNKLGIKIAGDDSQCANEFDVYELTWSNNTRNVVLQIAYTL
ncbi:hypothetical protein [Methylicorpusculum sp.]|uniref:hypothetical protein n=1 Tax=Methylicorpusculum sp. TaxID=2713644 RepID=UPI002726AF2A|nr:hypothetical protein [Methylicorpusculum sp.]MDO8845491.1 hypothetical protein [Methylicorpusculum sp.]